MQIDGSMACWGQMELVPEAAGKESVSISKQEEENTALQKEKKTTKQEEKETYAPSEEAMLKLYIEQLRKQRESAKTERDAANEELKALKIARNIMRGKTVPAQDESFLLAKNYKLYMAAKSVGSMKQTGEKAKSELGNETASSIPGNPNGGDSGGSIDASDILVGAGEAAVVPGATEATAGVGAAANASKSTGSVTNTSGGSFSTYAGNSVFGKGASGGIFGSISSSKRKKKAHKRFFYNFKDVSAKVVNAKTSGSARQVLGAAKRKCAQLRRKLKTGEYDDEAIKLALIHAEAIERVAKKKMKHLQEEEAGKRGGQCAGDTEREDIEEQLRQDELAEMERQTGSGGSTSGSGNSDAWFSEDMSLEELMAEALQSQEMVSDFPDEMEALMQDLSELMKDSMEEMSGLEELAEELMGESATPDMDPEDLKAMKIKHRNKEQKDIAEADSKYLKAFFQKLQREQQAAASGAAMVAQAMADSGSGGMYVASRPSGSGKTSGGTATGSSGTQGSTVSAAVAADTMSADVSVTSSPAPDIGVSANAAVSAVAGACIDVSL